MIYPQHDEVSKDYPEKRAHPPTEKEKNFFPSPRERQVDPLVLPNKVINSLTSSV